ncbi:Aspartic peptidase domain superfamily [Sesbania bispinosa]|nr:Aspartic peptidase domain superfamily [Sesbania bispinosa]
MVENNNERSRIIIDQHEHSQPELDLLKNLETPVGVTGNARGDTPLVVSATVLNSIFVGQQSLANMVTDLSTIVHSQRKDRTEDQINAAKEVSKHNPPSAIFDLEPPLADIVTTIPYHGGYQPPTFRKFDGMGSVKEHIMSFLDDLGIHRGNKNLRLKEFSKSLEGRAFTWYAKLKPYSIETWEDLVTELWGKFLEEEGALYIMDGGITTCAELMKKETDVTDAMKRQGKRTKGLEDIFDVCATKERDRKKTFMNNRSSGKATTFSGIKAPPIHLGRLQVCQLIEEWLKDGTLRLKVSKAPLTKEQSHATTIIFREPSDASPQFCHNRPLYVEATIEGIKVRRALVDNDSGVNFMPSSIFHKLKMPRGRIRKSDVMLSTFHGEAVESLGRVHAVLKVGPIKMVNTFQVVEGDSSYHLLLGRPWIHLHQCVPSTVHQCIKSNFREKEIEIPGVNASFEATKSHLIDASLFDEVAPQGSSQLKTEQGILLKDIKSYSEPGYTPHPIQAFKRPKAKNPTRIENEYLPNGEVRWRVL